MSDLEKRRLAGRENSGMVSNKDSKNQEDSVSKPKRKRRLASSKDSTKLDILYTCQLKIFCSIGWINFIADYHNEVRTYYPYWNEDQIIEELSRVWQGLPEEQREYYQNVATPTSSLPFKNKSTKRGSF